MATKPAKDHADDAEAQETSEADLANDTADENENLLANKLPQEKNEEPTLLADKPAEDQTDNGEKNLATDDGAANGSGNGGQDTAHEELATETAEDKPKKKKNKKKKKQGEAQGEQSELATNPQREELYAQFLAQSHGLRGAGTYSALVRAIPLYVDEDTYKDYLARLHEAFWLFADIADPWLPAGKGGLKVWQRLKDFGLELYEDEEHDPDDAYNVFRAAQEYVEPYTGPCSAVVTYGNFLQSYVERPSLPLIPFDDEKGWRRELGQSWP